MQPRRALQAILFAAETAWQSRRIEDARQWADRGIEAARSGGDSESLAKLLPLIATLANLRGEYARAAAYQEEIEKLAPREKAAEIDVPRGGTLVVAVANPIAATEPGTYETNEEQEALANVFETLVTTDAQGNLTPGLCERWALEEGAQTVRLHLRSGVVFSDGAPLSAPAVKASLERSIRLSRNQMPAAFVAISGVTEYLEGKAGEVSGITAPGTHEIEIRLKDPLPIFPSLLSDPRTGIAAAGTEEGGTAAMLGTGPFRKLSQDPDRVVLERNPRFWKEPPRLDRIEFRLSLSADRIAQGLRSGELDLARDLLPRDLEAILREPRFRAGLVETPKKNSYFATFHTGTPAGSNVSLRQALASAARTQDLVWGALGRFALPATGVIPPGILGHDPGRRQAHLPREKAIEMIRSSGLPLPVRLKASVHPILQNQYSTLTQALFRIWAELGVEVEVVTRTMPEFLESWHAERGIDVLLGRWIADYDDPDNFTFTLFHSGSGSLRTYFSSPEADRILEEARSEAGPAAREDLYRKFEHVLLDSAILVPLFHDVDYRIASANVRGLQLRSIAPYVNYAEVGKAQAQPVRAVSERPAGGGILNVPIAGVVRNFDTALSVTAEDSEVISTVFETLTWAVEGTRIVPWLASEVVMEKEGTRFRFRLRPDVRFHDGRRLTARDVRYSFERLLASPQSSARSLLSPVRGATRLLEGSGTDLEGFHIVSRTEFFIDLEKPVSFFPALLSYTPTAIIPEGTGVIGPSVSEGAIGTGPFRLVSFEPGRRLELERNPHYWREGYPRSEGIVFRFGVPPEEIRDEFLAGRLSLASDLLPAAAEAFRHDPRFASGYRESPRLTTYFVAVNRHRGVLIDAELRRSLLRAVDVAGFVRKTLGRLAIPAHGIIPPGLLGYSASGSSSGAGASSSAAGPDSSAKATVARETVELSAAVHPIFYGEFSAFARELTEAFREIGFLIRPMNKTMAEYIELTRKGETDLNVGRWNADYPDADTFVHGLLHSETGFLGRYAGSPDLDHLADRGRSGDGPAGSPHDLPAGRRDDRPGGPAPPALPRPGLLVRAARGRRARHREPGKSVYLLRESPNPAIAALGGRLAGRKVLSGISEEEAAREVLLLSISTSARKRGRFRPRARTGGVKSADGKLTRGTRHEKKPELLRSVVGDGAAARSRGAGRAVSESQGTGQDLALGRGAQDARRARHSQPAAGPGSAAQATRAGPGVLQGRLSCQHGSAGRRADAFRGVSGRPSQCRARPRDVLEESRGRVRTGAEEDKRVGRLLGSDIARGRLSRLQDDRGGDNRAAQGELGGGTGQGPPDLRGKEGVFGSLRRRVPLGVHHEVLGGAGSEAGNARERVPPGLREAGRVLRQAFHPG